MYLLDANVFIQARRGDYAFDLCPGFWDWLDRAHSSGLVYSIDSVRNELLAGADELSLWISTRGAMFLPPSPAWVPHIGATATWANAHPTYLPAAKAQFLAVADSQLVAVARATTYTLVTHETREPGRIGKIKIPDACDALGVTTVTPRQMLRAQGATFVLP